MSVNYKTDFLLNYFAGKAE